MCTRFARSAQASARSTHSAGASIRSARCSGSPASAASIAIGSRSLGWSHGGSTTLATINAGNREVASFSDSSAAPPFFRAAVAFYPGCTPASRDAQWHPGVPTRILIGAADDWTPASACEALGKRARRTAMAARGHRVSGRASRVRCAARKGRASHRRAEWRQPRPGCARRAGSCRPRGREPQSGGVPSRGARAIACHAGTCSNSAIALHQRGRAAEAEPLVPRDSGRRARSLRCTASAGGRPAPAGPRRGCGRVDPARARHQRRGSRCALEPCARASRSRPARRSAREPGSRAGDPSRSCAGAEQPRQRAARDESSR